jgi:hypothetical protein
MSSFFQTISGMVDHSSIATRNEIRNEKHNPNGVAGIPIHPPHPATGLSVSQTLNHLSDQSTIYRQHDQHHREMQHNHHNAAAGNGDKPHMTADMTHHHDTVAETLAHMSKDSSIFDRNVRRDDFLHPHQSSQK